MAQTLQDLIGKKSSAESNNKVGTIESMLSGIASGLIAIPKGFFSLGASLMDLGSNTGKAAAVEQWFDDLTTFDEKAEATAAGKITELLVNIGIPGGIALKGASGLAKSAMLAKQNGKYVKLNDPKLLDKLGKGTTLTGAGRTRQAVAGALGAGAAEATFVGDVEDVGTFGDLLGGPTKINRDEEDNAVREILNRVKFGTEGALFTGAISGAGTVIKKLTNRNKQLDVANSKMDRWIDKVASKFRARSDTPQEFFDISRGSIGARAADANVARTLSRELDVNIDALFPPMRTLFNKQSAAERKIFLEKVNKALLSGDPKISDELIDAQGLKLGDAGFDQKTARIGRTDFGPMVDKDVIDVHNYIDKFAKDSKIADELKVSITGGLFNMRTAWSKLFSSLGDTLDAQDLKSFKDIFGGKFKNYLGSTYDVFLDKSILPWLRYRPSEQAVEKAKRSFMESAEEAGTPITEMQAEAYVNAALKEPLMPKGMKMDKPSDLIFERPEFFVNRTTLKNVADGGRPGGVTARGSTRVSIGDLKPGTKEVFEELFGKNLNPMQTMLGGMAKLSLLTRRNVFFRDLLKKNDELTAAGKKPMFVETYNEAVSLYGNDVRQVRIDPAKTLTVYGKSGAINPFERNGRPLYAPSGIADALEKTSQTLDSTGALGRIYESLVLYPKATSQIAKTILSPVTHMRNFVSAGAFAAANGILPFADKQAIKQAYQALQTPLKGTRQQNELYQELLELGVVNSNVRLGDLSRLLEDVNFGETMTSDKGMRLLLKPLSKLKSISQDLYTAEDDFWKIYSWAMEKSRLEKAFEKIGVTRGQSFKRDGVDVRLTEDFLKREAADIVKNNIPNYDYVSDFIKGLRKLPIGNFVSFPAEIARTGTNIVSRALREIGEEVIVDGKAYKPFQAIGYTRLFGFGATTAAVPMGAVAAFQAIYDVTDEEREAIRKYVAQWSKNSTILPIKDEDGNFSYIDFSHANAYDTLTRPIQSVINAVAEGRTDNDGIMDDFARGMFTAMSEFGQPFISESIWTEAVLDIIARGGRTREGFQVYNPEDTAGDKNYKIMQHLVKAQMPFSLNQLQRLDRSIESVDVITKGKFDEYGQDYEFGDEFAGLFGFRSVKINPERTLRYKVADFQRGSRDSRSLFTRLTLKGGPIEPREIVDAYLNANRALFENQKAFKQDIDAARILNISESGFIDATDRISGVALSNIDQNVFRPMTISPEVRNSFAENAEKIGIKNPYETAEDVITEIQAELGELSLEEPNFPFIENPLTATTQSNPVTGPNTISGLGSVDQQVMTQSQAASQFSNLTMDQKIRLLFPQG
jgi:hypothetical protein